MIEYYGEYLGHGISKTAFELTSKNLDARFHGEVLKVAQKIDTEPSVFMEVCQLMTKI